MGSIQETSESGLLQVPPARGLVVELAGMPGSGKSTIYRETLRLLKADDVEISRALDYPLGESEHWVGLTHPELWRHADSFLRRVEFEQHRAGHVLRDPLYHCRELWFSRIRTCLDAASRPGLTLLEEGTLNEMWRMAYLLRKTGFGRRAVERLWPSLPKADVVVHLVCPSDVRFGRMMTKKRLGPINRDLTSAGAGGWVDSVYKGLHDFLLADYATPWGVVVEVPNGVDKSVEVSTRVVTAIVADLARPLSP